MPPNDYDPEAYWARLHETGDLRSVGQSALPEQLNRHLYAIARRNVLRFARRHGVVDPAPARVFEAGVGTGFWAALWLGLGSGTVDGCDLAPAAVERLRLTFPGRFVTGDLAEPGVVPDDRSYNLVTAMNVLLHIVDDQRFEAALHHLAGAVAPGGRLLLAEPILTRSPEPELRPGASSRARSLSRYVSGLAADGLVLESVEASTALGANPIEREHPRYRPYLAAWKRTCRWSKLGPRRAHAVGLVLEGLDRVVVRAGEAPSGKLVLFRRPG